MSDVSELLIVSVTPQNLERGDLWFKENLASIKKARISNQWWRDNSLVLEKDLKIKPSEFLRKLVDFGYERAPTVVGKGLFALRGGIIEIWPTNAGKPYLIEFTGNTVAEIRERPESEEKIKLRIPSQKIEKLPPGAFVVHVDHGIGIFRGVAAENEFSISNFQFSNKTQTLPHKFFVVEYAPPAPGR